MNALELLRIVLDNHIYYLETNENHSHEITLEVQNTQTRTNAQQKPPTSFGLLESPKQYNTYVINFPSIAWSASFFLTRTAKEWNTLPASLFPEIYNLELSKSRVNRRLLDKRVTSSAISSFNIRWDCSQGVVYFTLKKYLLKNIEDANLHPVLYPSKYEE